MAEGATEPEPTVHGASIGGAATCSALAALTAPAAADVQKVRGWLAASDW